MINFTPNWRKCFSLVPKILQVFSTCKLHPTCISPMNIPIVYPPIFTTHHSKNTKNTKNQQKIN